jgi:PTS system nitrogen regulatory IIA component
MQITDLLSADDVVLDLSVASRRKLLQALATEAASRLGCPEQKVLDALKAREQLGSTALGKGVALPHAQIGGNDLPVMLFARLRRPIDFEAGDDEPIDLVFLVLWPEAFPEGFLPALSEICRVLREPEMLRRLRLARSPEDVVALLHQGRFSTPGAAPTPGVEQ